MTQSIDKTLITPASLRSAGYSVKKVSKTLQVDPSEILTVMKSVVPLIFNGADIRMTPTGKLITDAKLSETANVMNQFLYKYVDGIMTRCRLIDCNASALSGEVNLKFIAYDDSTMKATIYTLALTGDKGFMFNYFNCKRNRGLDFSQVLKKFFSL